LPSKRDYQYAGIIDERVYFLKIIVFSIFAVILLFLYGVITSDPISGITNGIIFALIILFGGIFYPKLKLTLFRGEIKIQVLMSILHLISMLNSGASVQEAIKNIANNPEYGLTSYEFRSIIKDINQGGYNFVEALERAKVRSKIPLLKKLYDQLILAANKGGTQLLLENLYNEIVRESLSKIDSSKFQISNLGNLIFGIGLIIPFSGMIQSALGAQQGFDGIINAIDLVMTKIGLLSTIIFTIFIKMKIE
jgi:flagellar protein FlaJ